MSRCTTGTGERCAEEASVRLHGPDGHAVPGSYMCVAHAAEVVAEYRAKLGEEWSAQALVEGGPVRLGGWTEGYRAGRADAAIGIRLLLALTSPVDGYADGYADGQDDWARDARVGGRTDA